VEVGIGMAVPAVGLRSSGLSNQFWFGHGAGEVKKAAPPGGGYCMVCVQRQWNYDNGLGEKQRKRGWWSLLQSRQRRRSSVNLVWRLGFQISRVEETRTTGSSSSTTTTVLVNCGFQGSADTGIVTKNKYKINLDEYMVTLDRPLGIRFAQTLDGKIFVEALAKQVSWVCFVIVFPFFFRHDFALLPPSCCYCCNSSRTGILQLTSCSLPPHGLLDPVNLNLSCLRNHV